MEVLYSLFMTFVPSSMNPQSPVVNRLRSLAWNLQRWFKTMRRSI